MNKRKVSLRKISEEEISYTSDAKVTYEIKEEKVDRIYTSFSKT